jgi:purine-binding chemotaxis protein CheW
MKKIDSYIIFKVDNQSFGLSVNYVQGILELPKIFIVPQAPAYILGVVNIDGDVIPLINTGLKLNMSSTATHENSAVIVLERTHQGKLQKLCLLIDEVLEVIDINPLEIQALPTSKFEFDERLVDGMYSTAYDFVMQINVDNFFKHNLEDIIDLTNPKTIAS